MRWWAVCDCGGVPVRRRASSPSSRAPARAPSRGGDSTRSQASASSSSTAAAAARRTALRRRRSARRLATRSPFRCGPARRVCSAHSMPALNRLHASSAQQASAPTRHGHRRPPRCRHGACSQPVAAHLHAYAVCAVIPPGHAALMVKAHHCLHTCAL